MSCLKFPEKDTLSMRFFCVSSTIKGLQGIKNRLSLMTITQRTFQIHLDSATFLRHTYSFEVIPPESVLIRGEDKTIPKGIDYTYLQGEVSGFVCMCVGRWVQRSD